MNGWLTGSVGRDAALEPRINPAVRPAAWIPGTATVNADRLTVAQARAAKLAGASSRPEWPVHKVLRQGSPVTEMTNGSAGHAAPARYHAAESLPDPAEPSDGTSAGPHSTSTGQPGPDPHSGIAYALAATEPFVLCGREVLGAVEMRPADQADLLRGRFRGRR